MKLNKLTVAIRTPMVVVLIQYAPILPNAWNWVALPLPPTEPMDYYHG